MTASPSSHDEGWETALAQARDALRQWRATHPRATFTEIETAVDAQMQRVRAQLVAEAAGGSAPPSATACPTCGQRLHARGQRTRTLTVAGDEPVTLTRAYLVCPGCGTGLFPPR